MMTLPFYALSMLCGLGAVVFAAASGPSQRSRVSAATMFCIGAGWTAGMGVPPPEAIGCLAAAGAAVFLLRSTWVASAAGLGGALAGVWSGVLATQGLTRWVAVPLALASLSAAMLGQRNPEFAPPHLRDEGLVLVCALALGVAMLPGVLDGWSAAQNLTVQPANLQGSVVPAWTLAMTSGALGLGGGYALWSRR